MKLSVFNKKAPKLINQFSAIINRFLAENTADLNMAEIKQAIAKANTANKAVGAMLTGVNKDTLLKLRSNAAHGNAYGLAIDHHASLANMLPVLSNMVDCAIKDEDSIDDIMGGDEGTPDPEPDNMDDEGAGDDELDDILGDENSANGGPAPIGDDSPAAESGELDGTAEEAAVPEGTDANFNDADFDFAGVNDALVTKKPKNSAGSGQIVAKNFLT